MKKHLGIAAAVGIGAAAVTAAAVHGYLDVMYKETIPDRKSTRLNSSH